MLEAYPIGGVTGIGPPQCFVKKFLVIGPKNPVDELAISSISWNRITAFCVSGPKNPVTVPLG